MSQQLIIGILALLLIGTGIYTLILWNEKNSESSEMLNIIEELKSNISELSKELAEQKQQNQVLSELLKNMSESYVQLQTLKNELSNNHTRLLDDYNRLSRELNQSLETIRELRSKNNTSEWEMFKNLSGWFRSNLNFKDTELRSKILRECSDLFSLKIPCATYLMRDKYGYINRVSEFYSLSRFFEVGRGDCKHHALALRAFLKSLDGNMFLEGMKKVSIVDYEYFFYPIYKNVRADGYTTHLFSRAKDYDFVVVCFNLQNKGHCGVGISSIKVNSYRDMNWGFVVDPLNGEVLGALGNDFRVCDFSDCFREPNRITMVIADDWIDYFDGKQWRRLQ